MELLLKHPIFWIGIISGLILGFIFHFFNCNRKENADLGKIYGCKVLTDKLLTQTRQGNPVDLEAVFRPTKENNGKVGYLTWQALAIWLASAYANYEYFGSNVNDFWKLVEICFGTDSCAYIKMQALDEIINRSTYYYVERCYPHLNTDDKNRRRLFTMVQMIVDSYAPDVYERCRNDKKQSNYPPPSVK